jgi:hypothetical protein
VWLPKILGTYELELRDTFEQCSAAPFDLVIYIGAAEGYYAVGMALRNPRARVISFELNAMARHLFRVLANRNGVAGRLALHGCCHASSLQAAIPPVGQCLVICDCEGAEATLLDPVSVPALSRATIIAEMHDHIIPRVTETIGQRFAGTHEILVVPARARTLDDFPVGYSLANADALQAMDELRPRHMRWLVLKPTNQGLPG